jgi:hypothetical protein
MSRDFFWFLRATRAFFWDYFPPDKHSLSQFRHGINYFYLLSKHELDKKQNGVCAICKNLWENIFKKRLHSASVLTS